MSRPKHVPAPGTAERQQQLSHGTAEAMSVIRDPLHWRMLRLARTPGFRMDCRSIARELDVTVDQVNIAFSRLLRLRLLETGPEGEWRDLTGLKDPTEAKFRKLALARIRQKLKT